jgi:predicted DNA-binding protein (MmcQ/YjbR family)
MAKKPIHPSEKALRTYAMGFPEAYEEFPWGERAFKVAKKVFLFMHFGPDKGLSLSMKLPDSGGAALAFPFAEPTGYGLGKAGWVSARFGAREKLPIDLLEQWIEESYRAVAPKKLVAQLRPGPKKKLSAATLRRLTGG